MTKQQWRSTLLQQRRARSGEARQAAQSQNTAHLLAALGATLTDPGASPLARHTPVKTVCVYLPLPSEPLEPTLPELLVTNGFRVLVPVTQYDGPLEWCELGAAVAPPDFAVGAFGIAEPTGPRLGPKAIVSADVVLVPALAVDVGGTRLGRGKGHYDRSLALLVSGHRRSRGPLNKSIDEPIHNSMPCLVAVLFDGEIVPHLPAEKHDVPVTDVVTPTAGWHHVVGEIAPENVAQQGPDGALSS